MAYLFRRLTNCSYCFAARPRRLRILRRRELRPRPAVLNKVWAYTDYENRAAHSLLGYTRRGSYVRERRTSGSGPLSEGSEAENDPIRAVPISAVPLEFQDFPADLGDLSRLFSGAGASTSAAAAGPSQPATVSISSSTPSTSNQGSAAPEDSQGYSPDSLDSVMVRRAPRGLGVSGRPTAAPTAVQEELPPLPMDQDVPSPPVSPLEGRRQTPVETVPPQARRPELDPEDVPPATRARTEAAGSHEVQTAAPWNPPLVYGGRQVTGRDRISESVNVSIACARALLLPRDIAAIRNRTPAQNAALLVQNLAAVSPQSLLIIFHSPSILRVIMFG